jgi:uncharacterized protein YdaU (DUF1376 family)
MTLSIEERGVYITAIAAIYSAQRAVKISHLRALCPMHGNSFNPILLRLVESGKLTRKGDEIHSKRCRIEIEKASKRVRNAAENGLKGGRPQAKPKAYQNPRVSKSLKLPSPSPSPPPPSEESQPTAGAPDEEVRAPQERAPPPAGFSILIEEGGAILGGRRYAGLVGMKLKRFGADRVRHALHRVETTRPRDRRKFFCAVLDGRCAQPPPEPVHVAPRPLTPEERAEVIARIREAA